MKKIIFCFVKFFDEEKYADEFIKGNLFFRRLLDFKKIEEEHDGVRQDENEGVCAWFQPKGIKMTLNIKNSLGEEFENIEITEKDLAAPISISSEEHNYFHVFCMYAVFITDFEKHCDTEEEKQLVFEELNKEKNTEIKIHEDCFKFGKFAVLVDRNRFFEQVKAYFKNENLGFSAKLIDYYDNEIFNGEINNEDIIFKKQKKYSYQKEYRIAFNSKTVGEEPRTINIGSLEGFSFKTLSSNIDGLIKIDIKPKE